MRVVSYLTKKPCPHHSNDTARKELIDEKAELKVIKETAFNSVLLGAPVDNVQRCNEESKSDILACSWFVFAKSNNSNCHAASVLVQKRITQVPIFFQEALGQGFCFAWLITPICAWNTYYLFSLPFSILSFEKSFRPGAYNGLIMTKFYPP